VAIVLWVTAAASDTGQMRPFPRPGLLLRFSLLSLACVVALGIVLGERLHTDADETGLSHARGSAELLVASTFGGLITPGDLAGPLTPDRRQALDRAAARAKRAGGLVRIKLWMPDGRIAYSDDAAIIGRRFDVDGDISEALEGKQVADITHLDQAEQQSERGLGTLIEAYVPFRFDGAREPSAVFEVYLPYAPVGAAVTSQIHRTYAVLAIGLLVLWLALYRIMRGASSRLQAMALESARQARQDSLTGLANRRLLHEELDARLAAHRPVALLLIDLDGFKEINDTLGHAAGDELLVELGARLDGRRADELLVARLGGDEFAVVADDAGDDALLARADAVGELIAAPFVIAGVRLHVTASIGVARADGPDGDAGALLRRADVAMYRAKRTGTRRELYTPDADPHHPDRLMLIDELLAAIDGDELVLDYQPTIDLRGGHVVGAEALVRWRHPRRGLLMPADFIPAAEQAGAIGRVTRHVLRLAITAAASWHADGLALGVAVNISARDLLEPELLDDIDTMLRQCCLPADALRLELTETALVTDPERCGDVLRRLDDKGIGIVLDDFGTGYSSLMHLQQLPVCALKIDRSFVARMLDDANAALIARATIEMGRALGLRVVAEGVETRQTLDTLTALGCHEAQGYYIARPQSHEAFVAWCRDRARPAA
jgi:diguanylate cyclase (GGDEF)-like protein